MSSGCVWISESNGSLEYRQRLQAEMEVKRIEKKLEKWILDQMTELI